MKYKDYLKSKDWKGLRKKAYLRAEHKCELCLNNGASAHHIKYPKRYTEDHLDNILIVCDKCHKLLHGLRESSSFYLLKSLIKLVLLLDQKLLERYKDNNVVDIFPKLELVLKKFKTRVITVEMFDEVCQ